MVHGWGKSSWELPGLKIDWQSTCQISFVFRSDNSLVIQGFVGNWEAVKRLNGKTHWFFLSRDTKIKVYSKGKGAVFIHCTWQYCSLPLLLLTPHETAQTVSAQSSTVTLEFFTWLEGKTTRLAIYSTSSDIKRWVQEIQYGKDSSFPMGWQVRSVVTIESTLGTKNPIE